MTHDELIAAGWEHSPSGPITHWYFRGQSAICYTSVWFAHNMMPLYRAAVLPGIPVVSEPSMERLCATVLPDGRTVREWALSPP